MPFIYIVVIAAAIIAVYGIAELYRLRVTDYVFESEKIPDELNNKKCVIAADLHCTVFGNDNERLIKKIINQSPDFLLLPGDLINGRSKKEFDYASNFLNSMRVAGIPVIYSLGNHELKLKHYTGEQDYFEYLSISNNLSILLNNNGTKGATDCLSGTYFYGLVGTPESYRPDNKNLKYPEPGMFPKTIPNFSERKEFSVLMAHDPLYFEEYVKYSPDLIISGHVHGGIIRLPVIGGLGSPRHSLFPAFSKGIYKKENTCMLVSGGIGWHTIPFRFNNYPEIITLSFRKTKGVINELKCKT